MAKSTRTPVPSRKRPTSAARSRQRLAIAGVIVAAGVGAVTWGLASGLNSPAGEPLVAPIDVPERPVPSAPPEPELTGRAAEPTPPPPSEAEDRSWTVTMSTTVGTIVLELDGAAAPQAVASFRALSEDGFFHQTSCHRLTTAGIFVLQCGDPTGTGMGGPAYRFGPIENAPEDDLYPAGTLAMARQGNNAESMGSQFFVVYQDSTIPSDSAGGYTVFGTVVEGLDIVEAIAQAGTATGTSDGPPALDVTVLEVSIQ